MMKYLAVIQDSFREALASRVLWLLLVMITFLLLVLAPLSYREVLTWRLGEQEVEPWRDLMRQVWEAGTRDVPSPGRRIWSLLDTELQERLVHAPLENSDQEMRRPFEFAELRQEFRRSVNAAIERRDFDDTESFRDVPPWSQELRELREADRDRLSNDEVGRRNRLLLEGAFPDLVRSSPPTSIQWKYGWGDLFEPFPLRGATMRQALQGVAALVMTWFVGAIGVIVAILVTSPIVPQMFDQGSLHLLLSKPLSRWLLLLAKFCGGCVFIAICAAYLITGLWLILGWRFDIWDAKLLLGIPIYVFAFAIYYSVSVLCGVIFRSPVVCIVLTILFWGACFTVGFAKLTFENTLWSSIRIARVFHAGDTLIAVNELGGAQQWDDSQQAWRDIFISAEQKQTRGIMLAAAELRQAMQPVGPVYDPRHERLIAAISTFPPQGNRRLHVAPRSEDWEPRSALAAPSGTQAIYRESDGGILFVTNLGLFRLTGDPLRKQEPVKLFGVTLPLPQSGPFDNVGPSDAEATILTKPSAAAFNEAQGELILYTRSTLHRLRRDERNKYALVAEHRLDDADRQPVVLAAGGSTIVLGRHDGRLQVLDATTFTVKLSARPEGLHQARFITAAPDGRWFAIVLHTGNLWLYDAHANTLVRAAVPGQGDISSASFSESGELYVADRAIRVRVYSLPDLQRERQFAPRMSFWMRGYYYGLLPLYTVFPKPGELGTTFDYLLSGKATQDLAPAAESLTAAQRQRDPWTPLWSSALFMAVMLALACAYIEWQEF